MLRASSSAPVRRQHLEGVETVSVAAAHSLWLLGADLCIFAHLDLRQIAPAHRARAMAQRVRQMAPFAHAGWHAADSNGRIALWCWDASRVAQAIGAQTGDHSNWQILPEQLFFEPRSGACVRELGHCEILERWEDEHLVFSARLPREAAEHPLWLRAAGLAGDASPPRIAATIGSTRWDHQDFDWRRLVRDPLAIAAGLLAGASLWLLWSLGQLAATELANQRLTAAIDAQQQRLAPVLAQREQALALAKRSMTIEALYPGPSALEAAAEFEHLVGTRYQRLLEWNFGTRVLRTTVQDAAPDNRAYVEALESSPWFDKVSISPSSRAEQLNLDIGLTEAGDSPPRYRTIGNGSAG